MAKFKPTALRVESLESRQMMAGDVTAYLSGGNLYLNEAAGQAGKENSVVISQLPGGQIRVTGNAQISNSNVSSLINGQTFQDFTVPGSLFVNFGGGNDRVIFSDNPDFAPHFVNVNINVAAPEPLLTPRTLIGGADTTLKTPDADQVFIFSAVTTGNMTITTGRDHDWISMGQQVPWSELNIGGILSINSGAGTDTVNMLTTQEHAAAKIDIQTYKKTEADADNVWLSNAISNGDLNLRTGAGDDSIHLNNCTAFHNINLNAGAGNDTAELIQVLAVDKLMADLGAGNDTLNLNTLYFSNDLNVILSGGDGFDSLRSTGIDPTHFGHFPKTSWERINGRLILDLNAVPITTLKAQ